MSNTSKSRASNYDALEKRFNDLVKKHADFVSAVSSQIQDLIEQVENLKTREAPMANLEETGVKVSDYFSQGAPRKPFKVGGPPVDAKGNEVVDKYKSRQPLMTRKIP